MSWHLIDQIKAAQQSTQQIKDEYDEVLELLIEIVNEIDYSEQLLHIEHAKQYLEQLKKKR